MKRNKECLHFAIEKLREATEFIGTGICIDAILDMIKNLEKEEEGVIEMDYDKDVLEDAVDLLLNHEDVFKEAIKSGSDFDYNDIHGLDSIIHDNVTDRSYSPEDAVFILENCENEETDSGLWEGLDDWREELSARAANSYSNDVYFKLEELYNELKEKFDEAMASSYESGQDRESYTDAQDRENYIEETDEDELIEPEEEIILNNIWEEFKLEHTVQPINPDSKEALDLLKEWIELNSKAGMWGGYPLGGSYIDARCGSGHGMPEVKDFVTFDHEVARKLPNIEGKYKDIVLNEIKKLENKLKHV